jgi:hypothetical protein
LEAAGREAMDLISQNQELLEAFTEAWQCIAWISMDLTGLHNLPLKVAVEKNWHNSST